MRHEHDENCPLEHLIGILSVDCEWAAQEVSRRFEAQQMELECEKAVLCMTVSRLGGNVEGRPTARLNFLQRVDELRRIEFEYLKKGNP